MYFTRLPVGFYNRLIAIGNFLQDFFLLAIRLYWGFILQAAGYMKIGALAKTAQGFAALGIPFPEYNAYLVGSVEFIGGWCLILGFAARLVSIPLAILLLVALFTAHLAGTSQFLSNPLTFLVQPPLTFLLVVCTLFVFGPGRISLDFLIEKLAFKRAKK